MEEFKNQVSAEDQGQTEGGAETPSEGTTEAAPAEGEAQEGAAAPEGENAGQ